MARGVYLQVEMNLLASHPHKGHIQAYIELFLERAVDAETIVNLHIHRQHTRPREEAREGIYPDGHEVGQLSTKKSQHQREPHTADGAACESGGRGVVPSDGAINNSHGPQCEEHAWMNYLCWFALEIHRSALGTRPAPRVYYDK